MARKRKAVDSGSTRKPPKRTRQSDPADVADSNDAVASGSAMSSTNTKPKRNPRRKAKDLWEEERLMTSTASQLIDIDIVKLLARPEAWEYLEENEKEEILNLLPEDIHPNRDSAADDPAAKIPALPESFLRYSNGWRDGIRQFQLDLQYGRYDPEWQRQAQEAMREREAGKFDKFKEDEFEEFWGQKQKMDKTIAAGQSSQVKLSTLIEHGVVRVGDVWKYSRVFANGGNKVLVEKEARILEINDSRLTFVIPPGQRVFLSAPQPSTKQSPSETPNIEDDKDLVKESQSNGTVEVDGHLQECYESTTKRRSPRKRTSEPEVGTRKKLQQEPMIDEEDLSSSSSDDDDDVVLVANPGTISVEITNPRPKADTPPPQMPGDDTLTATKEVEGNTEISSKTSQGHSASDSMPQDEPVPGGPSINPDTAPEIILPNIRGLQALGTKILEVDGRIRDVPNGNAWKEFRSYRDNQDMGSLWEVRQAWYFRAK